MSTRKRGILGSGGTFGARRVRMAPQRPPICMLFDDLDAAPTFGLSMGFGFPMRAVVVYENDQPGLF